MLKLFLNSVKSLKKAAVSVLLLTCAMFTTPVAMADEPFVGEMRWFAGNFAPRGWALCDGQMLPIAQHTALFSLLGTIYGGDGRTTFALPDMRGRLPLHEGQGVGLTPRALGQRGGSESEALHLNQLPSHTHAVNATLDRGSETAPTDHLVARQRRERLFDEVSGTNPADVQMASDAVGSTGNNQAHNNIPPYLGINCIIALQGIYPSRP